MGDLQTGDFLVEGTQANVHRYHVEELERLLGVSATTVRSLIRAGHVKPRQGPKGHLGYSFQDLILLRTAGALRQSGISGRAINRALRELRAKLPDELPMSGLAMQASGDRIAVRRGAEHWDADSGQYLLALELQTAAGNVVSLAQPDSVESPDLADEQFKEGYSCEADDAERAIDSYQRCLALQADHREARLNLGRLLHLAGRLEQAADIYRKAVHPDGDTCFNLGVVLEDLGRMPDAIEAYERALSLEPACADAHYNLARLHDAAGRTQDSLRHLLAYRRLSR